MKPLKLEPVGCKYGAPMGRCETLPENPNATGKLQLAHVPFIDGCYDRGGAYWGMPADLYHAEGYLDGEDLTTCLFVRADNHEAAKAKIRARFPNVKFYR